MRAIQFREFGGPDVLELVELPDPEPGPGQIRIRVRAVGVNPIDWKVRSGIMGGELPGGGGGAAELAVLPDYAAVPASLDFADAAGLPVAVETAVRTLDLGEVCAMIEAVTLSLPVAQAFPLEEVGAAHDLSQSGHVRGKLVLLI